MAVVFPHRPCPSTPLWSTAQSGIGRRSFRGVRWSILAPAMRTQDLWGGGLKRTWRGPFFLVRHISTLLFWRIAMKCNEDLRILACQLGGIESDLLFQNFPSSQRNGLYCLYSTPEEDKLYRWPLIGNVCVYIYITSKISPIKSNMLASGTKHFLWERWLGILNHLQAGCWFCRRTFLESF